MSVSARADAERGPYAWADRLRAFMEAFIEPGSVVDPDGWLGYERVATWGYRHRVTVLAGHAKSPLLPRVHRVASLLKRWLLGTHQGAVSFDQYGLRL